MFKDQSGARCIDKTEVGAGKITNSYIFRATVIILIKYEFD